MIKKGDKVKINDGWVDSGDDGFTWIAASDEEKGRLDIMPTNTGLAFPPISTVQHYMVSKL